MNWFTRSSKALAWVVMVILLAAVMTLTAREGRRISFLERAMVEALAPVQAGANHVAGAVYGAVQEIAGLARIRAENLRLREETERITALEGELAELRSENARLREALELVQEEPYRFMAARVVARNPDNWFGTALVNKGTAHGLKKGMTVVTPRGLVGRVVNLTPHTATVLLITDPESGVGGIIASSRDAGVVQGQAGEHSLLRMKFFSRQANVQPGDIVLTSGLGSIFPKGIAIGRVVEVGRSESGLLLYAEVEPFADINRLEEVLILVNEPRGETP